MNVALAAALVLAQLVQSALVLLVVERALRRADAGQAQARLRLASWAFFGAAAFPLAGLLLPNDVRASFGPDAAPLFRVRAIVVRGDDLGAFVQGAVTFSLAALGLGCAIRFGRTLVAVWRGEQIAAHATEVNAADYGLPAGARVASDDAVGGPLVAGLFRPVIVVPRRLFDERSEHLRAVLAHEFAHVEHNDVRRALRQRLVADLYWWNPFMRGLSEHLREQREFACDERAARARDGFDVAAALLREARALCVAPRAHALCAATQSGLARRVERLLGKPKPLSAALAVALVSALLVGAAFAPRSPETGRTHIGIARG